MKNYVVAMVSFFDNDIKQFKVEAENEFEAIKKAAVENTSVEFKSSEIDFQNSGKYPKDIDELESYYASADMSFSVIEI